MKKTNKKQPYLLNILNNNQMKKILLIAAAALTIAACTQTTPTTQMTDTQNTAYQNILTRTSVRQWDKQRPVPSDTIDMLLRAAMSAPTAMNKQPWAFIVLTDRPIIDTVNTVLPWAGLDKAPMAIITCADLSKACEGETPDRGFWIQDVSAATENLLLAAHALGLGAVWTGIYPEMDRVNGVREKLALPENIIPLAAVPVGYPEGTHTPKDKYTPQNIHYNGWSQTN